MTEPTQDARTPYDVAVLFEQELSELDARQLTSLHEGLDDPVVYHLLLPVEDAAATMATSLGVLGGADLAMPDSQTVGDVDNAIVEAGQESLQRSIDLIVAAGKADTTARGALTHDDPVSALADLVTRVGAEEAIILTTSHVFSEFFHVDWASRAERKLHVPTLRLIEHESFDAQSAGAGEGASLI
ncbi:hypothetical protein KV102_18120 [Mumia sp. zg.B53]|uniref:hypothetical protein n=1 Tax=unclassified Mumia TaxID=2621872 RepID=UPI001C6DD87B|nr:MULTISPECIES: hypothetical protein [unclassified Mumia]MBW9206117.1 hypothetical protein [Mumia sp. zg.B17]MBW9211591.1 hypothetical protein [Mumia sp. zg.B21]MBW9216762.1 hypothetical protein [Mumia sp. zg.B53]MDD9347810.1 hypothetical protein [Mumia sp.]